MRQLAECGHRNFPQKCCGIYMCRMPFVEDVQSRETSSTKSYFALSIKLNTHSYEITFTIVDYTICISIDGI